MKNYPALCCWVTRTFRYFPHVPLVFQIISKYCYKKLPGGGRFGREYFKKDYDANDSAALLWRSLSQIDSCIWPPSEFGAIWSVDQGEEQPAPHRGPPACGYSDLLRSCLGLHEWLAEESLAKPFPFLLLFLFSLGSMKILPNHTSHII